MARFLKALILVLIVSSSQAQSPVNTAKDCAITGSVVDSVSGAPLAGAQVFARTAPMAGNIAQPAATSTDTAGEFKLENLSPGRYFLRAMHAGYVDRGRAATGSAAKPLVLSQGQKVDGFVLTLTPGGIISGHITDETGKAVSGAAVALMRSSYRPGKRESSEANTVTTDESGEYRFTGLTPGRYYLRATSHTPSPSKGERDKTYVPVYYPRATEQAGAALLEVRPGEEVGGIDLSFTPVRAVRIAGQVVDGRTSLPSRGAEVTLLSDQGNATFPSGQITAGAKGEFELKGVPAGSYIVVAQSSSTKDQETPVWGKAAIEVADVDLTGVKVVISPGVTVTGHIRAEGKTNVEIGRLSATLEPREGTALLDLMPDVESAQVNAEGMFTFRNVPDGSYDVSFSPVPAGFYLKTANGEPLETVTVGRGHGSSIPEITLGTASAWVSGTVSNSDQPVAGATVVLVPGGKRQNLSHYYKTSISDKYGKFTLRGVAPGDYKLFAWEEVERNAYMDPDFLRDYEDRGQSVHVEDSPLNNLQVDVIPASDMAH